MVSASSLVISWCLRSPLWLSCQVVVVVVVVVPFLSDMVSPCSSLIGFVNAVI